MKLLNTHLAVATVLATACLFAGTDGAAAAKAKAALKLDCECRSFSGGDVCHAFLTIEGNKLSFGAFETSGSGPLKVGKFKGKPLYSSTITTGTGGKLRVFAFVPRGLDDVKVNTDKFNPGKAEFVMRCK